MGITPKWIIKREGETRFCYGVWYSSVLHMKHHVKLLRGNVQAESRLFGIVRAFFPLFEVTAVSLTFGCGERAWMILNLFILEHRLILEREVLLSCVIHLFGVNPSSMNSWKMPQYLAVLCLLYKRHARQTGVFCRSANLFDHARITCCLINHIELQFDHGRIMCGKLENLLKDNPYTRNLFFCSLQIHRQAHSAVLVGWAWVLNHSTSWSIYRILGTIYWKRSNCGFIFFQRSRSTIFFFISRESQEVYCVTMKRWKLFRSELIAGQSSFYT